MRIHLLKRTILSAMLAAALCPASTYATNGKKEFTREKGVIARVGAGAPANFNFGAGYRFNPHLDLVMEAYSYSGLTTFAGALDARYRILDNTLTPFVAAKIGYGSLGKTLEYKNYNDVLGVGTAGISWLGFDLGVGVIYDSFHKMEFTANLSWTYCFSNHKK